MEYENSVSKESDSIIDVLTADVSTLRELLLKYKEELEYYKAHPRGC
jgi:hypothetical protein